MSLTLKSSGEILNRFSLEKIAGYLSHQQHLLVQNLNLWRIDLSNGLSAIDAKSDHLAESTALAQKISQVAFRVMPYWLGMVLSYAYPLSSSFCVIFFVSLNESYHNVRGDIPGWSSSLIKGLSRGVFIRGVVQIVLAVKVQETLMFFWGVYRVAAAFLNEDLESPGGITYLSKNPVKVVSNWLIGNDFNFGIFSQPSNSSDLALEVYR